MTASDEAANLCAVSVDRTAAPFNRLASAYAQRRLMAPPSLAPEIGAIGLATCHRIELYVEGAGPEGTRRLFREWLGEAAAVEPLDVKAGADAARHLLRVAAGLESAALGEDEILRQVREAYRRACVEGSTGPLLHRLFHAAFRAGRRVRSETPLGAGTRSLAGAGIAAAHVQLGSLCGRTALVIGAGEMGATAARLLAERRVGRLLIANRTRERGAVLAAAVAGELVPWGWRMGLLRSADLVVCATGAPSPVIDGDALRCAGAHRSTPLCVIDLGVPANVPADPAPGVVVIDLGAIAARLARERTARSDAIGAATTIVEQELAAWLAWSRARISTGRRTPRAAGAGPRAYVSRITGS